MNLMPFCSRDETRPYLLQPWSIGDFTYATDGHICIRIPRDPSIADADHKAVPLAQQLFVDHACNEHSVAPVIDVPQSDDDDNECETCQGRGHLHDCPDCECECRDCRGTGYEEPGRGLSYGFGPAIFAGRVLIKMKDLPGLRFGRPDATKPMHFIFDGGEGVIMPMRGKNVTHIELGAAAEAAE